MTATAQRLWIWTFSLAFLALSGFNGYRLIGLEGSPWKGEPSTVRTLRAQLDRLSESREPTPAFEWREPYEDIPDAGSPAAEREGTASDASPSHDTSPVLPPVLSGIVAIVDPDGHPRFRALLDGHLRDVGQRAGTFLIVKISDSGVRLRDRRGDLFLPNHDPIFSIDHGNAHSSP